jgi:hypothetical protein
MRKYLAAAALLFLLAASGCGPKLVFAGHNSVPMLRSSCVTGSHSQVTAAFTNTGSHVIHVSAFQVQLKDGSGNVLGVVQDPLGRPSRVRAGHTRTFTFTTVKMLTAPVHCVVSDVTTK